MVVPCVGALRVEWGCQLRLDCWYPHRQRGSGLMFEVIDEQGADLEAVAVEEGCSTCTSCSSLDVSDVEFDEE